MKLFSCDHCGNTVYFENGACERCGHRLGYLPEHTALLSLEPAEGDAWQSPARPGESFLFCANAQADACNWLLPVEAGGPIYCAACRHNETIPNLDAPEHLGQWQTIERAKKRLFYSLLRLDLPLATRAEDPQHGLAFRFLDDAGAPSRVLTGHEDGIITIALAEADDAERESRRTRMGEPYRTLLGHFRHEIAHHYWDLLVPTSQAIGPFRSLFGDERDDYGAALERHYANGAPDGWPQSFISAYATSHPWEDFAETFAHYLHIVDTAEMAAAFGVRARPRAGDADLSLRLELDPYQAGDMADVIEAWVPLSLLLNNLNRAMGHRDAYPFVLTPAIAEKLDFIHGLVHGRWPRPA